MRVGVGMVLWAGAAVATARPVAPAGPAPTEGGARPRLVLDHEGAARVLLGPGARCHASASEDPHLVAANGLELARSSARPSPVRCTWQLRLGCAWDTEPAFPVAGREAAYPVLTTAFKVITMRHRLGLVLANMERVIAQGVVANVHPASRDLVVGFTFSRGFQL